MRSFYTPIFHLAPEVWVVLAFFGGLSAFAVDGECWIIGGLCFAVAALVALYGFDASVTVRAKPSGVLAIANGTVCFRRECHDPYLNREAIKLSIKLRWWGSYLFRAPVEAEITALPGAGSAVSLLCTDEDESIVIEVAHGSLLGASPVWLSFGERVGQGRLCGVRRFAQVINIYLPSTVRVEVALGQKVQCGHTVLASLQRRH